MDENDSSSGDDDDDEDDDSGDWLALDAFTLPSLLSLVSSNNPPFVRTSYSRRAILIATSMPMNTEVVTVKKSDGRYILYSRGNVRVYIIGYTLRVYIRGYMIV